MPPKPLSQQWDELTSAWNTESDAVNMNDLIDFVGTNREAILNGLYFFETVNEWKR